MNRKMSAILAFVGMVVVGVASLYSPLTGELIIMSLELQNLPIPPGAKVIPDVAGLRDAAGLLGHVANHVFYFLVGGMIGVSGGHAIDVLILQSDVSLPR